MPKPKRKAPDPPNIDRLPPHSEEAERGALGCFLLDSSTLAECNGIAPDWFYDLRNQEIFNCIRALEKRKEHIDVSSVRQRMSDAGTLDISHLSGLPEATPSPENIGYFLGILHEKYQLRRIIQTCTEVAGRAYDQSGPMDDWMFGVRSDLGRLIEPEKDHKNDCATWEDLLEFDTDNDPNNIIGMRDGKTTRWLCAGHLAWIIAPSGIGKSSILMQLCASFAAGLPLWGVAVARPMRILFIQAENDKGDLSEMAKGIEAGLGVDFFTSPEHHESLKKNLKFITSTGKIGQEFCSFLRAQILNFGADIVLVDPLLSFAGIDVSKMDQAGLFCRGWLDPVLKETGCVMIAAHHTGKPARNEKGYSPSLIEQAYAGIGSSELVNYARAVMLLQPAGDRTFRLVFAKRGSRAWATHPDGTPTQTLWLRHAPAPGLFWEQIDPPEEQEEEREQRQPKEGGRPSRSAEIAAMNLHSFCAACLPDGEGLNQISKRLEAWLSAERVDISYRSCQRIIPLLVANGKLTKTDLSAYIRGPNA